MTAFALHLLRHGEAEPPGRLMGRTDGSPTAAGIAACVAQTCDIVAEVLISSDLRRCHLAAEAISQALGLQAAIDPRWRELDFGDWDGLAAADIEGAALGRFWDDPESNPPPGGERWSALVARVSEAITELDPRPTLIVTHGGTMRAALAALCGFDQRQAWTIELPCAVLLSLQIWPGDRPSARITRLRP